MSIGYYFQRLLNKAAKGLGISALYYTSKGVKYLNPLMRSEKLSCSEEFYVEPGTLYLGFDGLKDEYTLVGVSICDSPHYGLMEALENTGAPGETDYCKRYAAGTLDSRSPVPLSKKVLSSFGKQFAKRKKEILEGVCAPVQVYCVEGIYYIADGKHRAALCAMMGKPIKCVQISQDYLNDSFRRWMLDAMRKRPKQYSKNIRLFDGLGK